MLGAADMPIGCALTFLAAHAQPTVMPGHSRSKNGVASLAYVPGIYVFGEPHTKDVDGRDKPGHDVSQGK